MRFFILAPICAALATVGTVDAQDHSQRPSDLQAQARLAAPVVTHVSPPSLTTRSACDAHAPGCQPHGGVAINPTLLPYHPPVLPPPASLYGYFNSPPEHLHLWDNYPREVALRHWHRVAKEHHLKGGRQHRQGNEHPYGAACP